MLLMAQLKFIFIISFRSSKYAIGRCLRPSPSHKFTSCTPLRRIVRRHSKLPPERAPLSQIKSGPYATDEIARARAITGPALRFGVARLPPSQPTLATATRTLGRLGAAL